MTDREERIEEYYQESAILLAEWLVDAEDELGTWKAKALRLERAILLTPHAGIPKVTGG